MSVVGYAAINVFYSRWGSQSIQYDMYLNNTS